MSEFLSLFCFLWFTSAHDDNTKIIKTAEQQKKDKKEGRNGFFRGTPLADTPSWNGKKEQWNTILQKIKCWMVTVVVWSANMWAQNLPYAFK